MQPESPPATLTAALVYFGLVFGAGFALGTVRVLWLVPRLGARGAELIEFPFMAAVLVASSAWMVRHYPLSPRQFLQAGVLAAALLQLLEFALVAPLQGRTPLEAILAKDPLTGTIYYALQVVFALLPWWRARRT